MVLQMNGKSNTAFLKGAEAAYQAREGVRRDTKAKAFLATVKRVLDWDGALDDVQFCTDNQGEEVPFIEIASFNFVRDFDFGEVLLLACTCANPECQKAHRTVVAELADVWAVHKFGHLCPSCQKGTVE